ncbi:hypothetical protein GGR28_000027 [Lewinella aquimaris]|uniref:Uncharacterized protein n=1 Tax=Neolewinella aquimaris TaxID=1835722 RepID=A0A840E8N5_9BACT|nr:hypothetical protein [Neolewinella aquimaris]MBB4077426.1 hypothetical protein [Neolewinella aquimaris]
MYFPTIGELATLSSKSIRRYGSIMLIPAILISSFIAIALAVNLIYLIPISELFRDPLALIDAPVYFGLLSQLGFFFWSIPIGALLLILALGNRLQVFSKGFILYSFLLTIGLALDDVFMLHETVLPDNLGIPEGIVFSVYIFSMAGYLIFNQTAILNAPFPILFVALGLFGVSMLTDLAPGPERLIGIDMVYLLEDGAKLGGIIFWTCFQLVVCRNILSNSLATKSAEQPRPIAKQVKRLSHWKMAQTNS